ncbi:MULTISPECIES: hypothetical protein [unclassified Streptomyces]|nr:MULTISPECIES: hypothetical protein [unclassified Streptomyces]
MLTVPVRDPVIMASLLGVTLDTGPARDAIVASTPVSMVTLSLATWALDP